MYHKYPFQLDIDRAEEIMIVRQILTWTVSSHLFFLISSFGSSSTFPKSLAMSTTNLPNKNAASKATSNASSSGDSVISESSLSTRRVPTLRTFQSSISSISDDDNTFPISERTEQMMERASQNLPLTDAELQDIARSLQNVSPRDSPIDFIALEALLKEVAHLSHKDWAVTSANAQRLGPILLGPKHYRTSSNPNMMTAAPHVGQVLERVLQEGNWQGGVAHAASRPKDFAPWAVLIAGCNGIRKTTAMYQQWFPQLLEEALDCPPGKSPLPRDYLPCGENSFFRQLDHMICTLCNEDFKMLYELTRQQLTSPKELDNPPSSLVKKYSDLKAAIFARYRTLSELLGGLLLQQAQQLNINCMVETSGKDVAMFHYVDHFFEGTGYNKLALHFKINDLTQAQTSVDARMVGELQAGIKALENENMFDGKSSCYHTNALLLDFCT
jgi:hypothetical protein